MNGTFCAVKSLGLIIKGVSGRFVGSSAWVRGLDRCVSCRVWMDGLVGGWVGGVGVWVAMGG